MALANTFYAVQLPQINWKARMEQKVEKGWCDGCDDWGQQSK